MDHGERGIEKDETEVRRVSEKNEPTSARYSSQIARTNFDKLSQLDEKEFCYYLHVPLLLNLHFLS